MAASTVFKNECVDVKKKEIKKEGQKIMHMVLKRSRVRVRYAPEGYFCVRQKRERRA